MVVTACELIVALWICLQLTRLPSPIGLAAALLTLQTMISPFPFARYIGGRKYPYFPATPTRKNRV